MVIRQSIISAIAEHARMVRLPITIQAVKQTLQGRCSLNKFTAVNILEELASTETL